MVSSSRPGPDVAVGVAAVVAKLAGVAVEPGVAVVSVAAAVSPVRWLLCLRLRIRPLAAIIRPS